MQIFFGWINLKEKVKYVIQYFHSIQLLRLKVCSIIHSFIRDPTIKIDKKSQTMQVEDSNSSFELDNSGKQTKKELNREKRREERKAVLAQIKLRPYYDAEQDHGLAKKYYKGIDEPSGVQGYLTLNHLLSSTFHHARRRINLFPVVDRHPDYTLRCVFTGRLLQDSQGNLIEKCDEEHSFPQSFQQGSKKGTGRDMHAIFAASKHANGSRGNKPFGVISGAQIVRDDERGTVFKGHHLKSYGPKLNAGAVARATLYILTCYRGCAAPQKLPRELLDWAVNTAASEPVTLWQRHRNAELHRLQHNRNPFVDHPHWARLLDFSEGYIK